MALDLVYRVVDIVPPEGDSYDNYSVEELTDRFASVFEEHAEADAEFYLES